MILLFITIFSENLRKCGLYKQMGRWIAKLPNCETVEVVSNISKTRWRPVTNKVPQDLVLGLLLFIILINSLDGGIEYTLSKISGNEKSNCVAVQRDLIRLREWAKRNSMMFNK